MSAKTVAIILAAGAGTRMGQPKALLRVHDQTLVERAYATALAAKVDAIIVIAGAQHERVRVVFDSLAQQDDHWAEAAATPQAGAKSIFCVNEHWERGVGTSFQVGLRSARDLLEQQAWHQHTTGAIILLVDQPGISSAACLRVRDALTHDVAAYATYATSANPHPIALRADIWGDVLAYAGSESGAMRWLKQHPELVQLVPCDDVADPRDLDSPADVESYISGTSRPGRN